MGCCLSTQNQTTPKTRRPPPISAPSNHQTVSKSPPRAEEEAVKEVLSETPNPILVPPEPEPEPISVPIPIPIPVPTPNPNPYYYTPIPKINHGPTANAIPRKQHLRPYHPPPHSPPSPATAGESEVRQRVPIISSDPAQIHKPTSFSNGKSPVRRANPSPVRNRVSDGQRRREFGENSGRRSGSPVTRNESVVNAPSARKTGISPARVRMVHPASRNVGAREEDEERDVGWDDPTATAPMESLENPLVSLECFIFL